MMPASGPSDEYSIRRSSVERGCDRRSTACRIDDKSWGPMLLTPPPIRINFGLKKLTSAARTSPIIRPLSWMISMEARSPVVAAAPTSTAVNECLPASRRSARIALLPVWAASMARSAMAGPASNGRGMHQDGGVGCTSHGYPFSAPARMPLMKYCPRARKNTSGMSRAMSAAAICMLYTATKLPFTSASLT